MVKNIKNNKTSRDWQAIDAEIQDMKAELKNLKGTLKEKADLDKLSGFEKRLIKVEKILLARMA